MNHQEDPLKKINTLPGLTDTEEFQKSCSQFVEDIQTSQNPLRDPHTGLIMINPTSPQISSILSNCNRADLIFPELLRGFPAVAPPVLVNKVVFPNMRMIRAPKPRFRKFRVARKVGRKGVKRAVRNFRATRRVVRVRKARAARRAR